MLSRESLDLIIALHQRRRHANSLQIYVAMEEREEAAATKASNLVSTFNEYFCKIDFTIHPFDLPSEVPGKSSNESWAVKKVLRDYPAQVEGCDNRDIVITIMDGKLNVDLVTFHLTNLCES